jgi:DNA-binding MarR family transcriptional regulator
MSMRQAREPSDKLDGGSHAKTAVRLELRLLTCTALIERRISARFRKEFDTTLPRFDFLAALDRKGELSLGEVSRLLMVSNGNVTGLAGRLKQDGLIEPVDRQGDRRAQYVRLTPEGARKFKTMAAAHETWVEAMFAELEDHDCDALLSLLDRAKASIRREVPHEEQP